jgi:hypothetical protein
MIKHHAFFEALGSMQEKSPEWNASFAGLSVLRLLDRLAEVRELAELPGGHEEYASRRAVESVAEGDPARAILLRILDRLRDHFALSDETGSDLISYGRALDLSARWSLAADVFETVANAFSERTSPHLVIEASTLLGAAARNTGDWETSGRAYVRAEHLAESTGDRAGALTAQVGIANNDTFRGDLQTADESLASIITNANALKLEKVEAIALHARAHAAHLKGEHQRTVHLAYRSLELTTNPGGRERLLADIAAAYSDLGMKEPARHGYSIVAITSPHQSVRWQCELNLMKLAADENDEKTFDEYVAKLESAAMGPRLMTYFMFYRAMGSKRFNRLDARSMFEEAQRFASNNRLHQLAFEIEAEMSKPPRYGDLEPTPELTRIAEVLEHLHDEALSKD